MKCSRRQVLRTLVGLAAGLPLRGLAGASPLAGGEAASEGNFRFVYADEARRQAFAPFLANVFHLYPEQELHAFIEAVSRRHDTDRDIYLDLQSGLADIKPFLSELTYALPALSKQKNEMAEQSVALLADTRRFDGYLEIGSTGRYVDALEERLAIDGERYFVAEQAPGYSLFDMIDRGQVFKAGEYIALNDYQTDFARTIAPASLDLVSVFIGFHHCPPPLREAFIGSIRDTLRPGGCLLVRDHNAHDETMLKMVALAHDVFNMGTGESWDYNARELRRFYSLEALDAMLKNYGFSSDGRQLYQRGDPTLNALMLYRKV